jgi:transcription elongation factor Spt5
MALARVAKKEKLDIRAILAPDELKGYVLVEAPKSGTVELAIQTIPHARALVKGSSSISEIEHFLKPKPVVTGIKKGNIEVTSGPFKGEKARVKRVDEGMRNYCGTLRCCGSDPNHDSRRYRKDTQKRKRISQNRMDYRKFKLINKQNHQYSEWIETNLLNSYL